MYERREAWKQKEILTPLLQYGEVLIKLSMDTACAEFFALKEGQLVVTALRRTVSSGGLSLFVSKNKQSLINDHGKE